MDPLTLSALISAGVGAISGVGHGIAAGRRAKYQGIQSAIEEEGKAKQEEFAGQAEKEASSLSSLIQAYRESLMG